MKNRGIQILLSSLIVLSAVTAFAQGPPPGGRQGRGRGFNPDEMIQREKQNVYKAIEDLSEDQKLLLDGIYDEYGTSFKELRDEVMETRDFQSMRPKMLALRDEKDGLIKDVLNEDQFALYQGLMDKQQRQRREAMERNRNRRQTENDSIPSEDGTTPDN